jgi:hypothetical protein
MKTIIKSYLIIFTSIVVSLTSCNLDEVILDTPTPTSITTETDVNAIIIGMYSRFNDSQMFKFLGHNMLTITADDIYSTAASEYGYYAKRTYTSANTNPMWANFNYTVRDANNLIDVLDKKEFSAAFEKRAYGEAYFIRAFSYYYLVRLYGGVPLRTKMTTIDSDFYIKRNTVEETYAQIFSDFKKASELLPLVAANLGHATKGAAQALLSQAYLTYGNQLALKGQQDNEQYTSAALYADSVIKGGQYALLANYGDLYDISKETGAYREVIFGIRFQTDNQNRAQPAAGSEFAYSFGAGNTYGVSAGGLGGNNSFRVSHWFADYYRTGDYVMKDSIPFTPFIDYRNEKAFHQRGYNPTTNNGAGRYFAVYPNTVGSTIPAASGDGTIVDPILAKYIDPTGKDQRNHGNDFFIIRLAEVYLIKAEALNEINGPNAEALAAFNEVRKRARTVNSVPNARSVPADLSATTAVDKDTFRMKIFDERGLELVGEGQRWFDLVRMRSPLSPSMTMYEYQFLHRLNDQTIYSRTIPTYNTTTNQYTTKNHVYEFTLNVTVPKFLLFPVPIQEIQQNPNFGPQNPGW